MQMLQHQNKTLSDVTRHVRCLTGGWAHGTSIFVTRSRLPCRGQRLLRDFGTHLRNYILTPPRDTQKSDVYHVVMSPIVEAMPHEFPQIRLQRNFIY
jgi:hypothetical protein